MENRNVLITGASGGIGYELAKIFAKKNNNLILVARNGKRLEEIREEFLRQGIAVMIIQKDLTQPTAAAEVYEEVNKRNIQVHILVNNAGAGRYGSFLGLALNEQLQMLQLNVAVLTQLTHLFGKDMVKNQFGRILNIGSISSFLPTPMMSVYAATKAYVSSLSESLNSEYRKKGDIAVIALCPGFTKTDFIRNAKFGPLEPLVNKIAMTPESVARIGYEAIARKKGIKVVGGLNTLMYFSLKVMPRNWLQKIATILFKTK